MKILHQDIKTGIIKLMPETFDDLWHLSHIISEGDLLSSKTTRRIQDTTGDKLRSDRGVKKTFYLGIRVQSVSFHMFTGSLRVTGTIESGPSDLVPLGAHHTIIIKLNEPIKITKEKWSRWTIKRLKKAIEQSKKLSSIIVVLEDDVADLGLIRQFGIEFKGPIMGNISGKRIIDKNRGKQYLDFYEKVASTILKYDDIQTIIIAGPGFVKNDFYDFLKDKHSDIAKKSVLESTGSGGRAGIQELLKNSSLEKITSENIISNEMTAVEELLSLIGKSSSLAVYGRKDTIAAVYMGAVEKLLVIDTFLREKDLEAVLDNVENMNGTVMVISTEHDGGKQLESLGGIAGILRYSIN